MGEFEKESFQFWNRKAKDARTFCLIVNIFNFLSQIPHLVSPDTKR